MAPPPGHPSRPLCGHPRPPSPLPPHCPHPTEQAFTYTDPSLKPQCSWGLVGPSPPTLRCPRAWRRPPLLPDGGLLSVPRVPLPGFPQGPPRAVCSAWSPGPPSVLTWPPPRTLDRDGLCPLVFSPHVPLCPSFADSDCILIELFHLCSAHVILWSIPGTPVISWALLCAGPGAGCRSCAGARQALCGWGHCLPRSPHAAPGTFSGCCRHLLNE